MKRIAIDVGHARGTGARGNGYEEHEVCTRLAAELKAILESFRLQHFSADIIDFPEETNSGDLTSSVKAINAGGYDLCISLHMDASDNATAHGAHVCYYSQEGKRLAGEIARRLCPQLPGRYEKTKRRTDLYILKRTTPVAVLVECGFITNPRDAEWVNAHPHDVARSIALGVAAHLEDYNESL